jgi:hypothetical protein
VSRYAVQIPILLRRTTQLVAVPICLGLLMGLCGSGPTTTVSAAPFAGIGPEAVSIGTRASAILNLQIWQTLLCPLTAEGRYSNGIVTWDFDSRPPTSFPEAEIFATRQISQEPQIVLWGRAWRYGAGIVAEPFLWIRYQAQKRRFGDNLWSISTATGQSFSVGVPDRQVEFAPIVISAEVLPQLTAPAGLMLYDLPTGQKSIGVVGDYFSAVERGTDTTKVQLPDGTQGWLRLPKLSHERSEVVDFTGGIIQLFRKDWGRASDSLKRVANDERAPTAVRSDAFLYLAIAEASIGKDALPWVSKAYQLTPYSKTTFQYLCMAKLDGIQKAGNSEDIRRARIEELQRLLATGAPMYAPDDPWFLRLKEYLDGRKPGVQ